MFVRFVAIFLILSVSCSCISQLLIHAGFSMNRKYITARFCGNVDKHWMHCDGKCFLAKKLKEASDAQKKDAKEASKFQAYEGVIQILTTERDEQLQMTHKLYPLMDIKAVIKRPGSIFHPPC